MDTRRKTRVLQASSLSLVLLTWGLLWLIQGAPTYCNGVQLCGGPDVRIVPTVSFGVALLIPVAVIFIRTRQRITDPDFPVLWVVFAALVLLAAIGLFWTLSSGGFGVSTLVVELVPRTLVLLGLAVLILYLLRRRKRMRSSNQKASQPH